jgi:hypothetical protein
MADLRLTAGSGGGGVAGNATPEDMAFVAERLRTADAATFTSTCIVVSHGLALRGGAGVHVHAHNQAAAVTAGVLEALLAGLARHGRSHTDALVAGVLFLNGLCVGSAPHRARALAAGALAPVLDALRAGAHVAGGALADDLAEAGSMAVYSLTAHSEAAVAAAVRGGVVEAVMACVAAHASLPRPQYKAFSALSNLTAQADGPYADAAERVTRLGAVEAVAAALMTHGGVVDNGDMVHWCGALLSALAGRTPEPSDADTRAARCGAAAALRAAAGSHVGNARPMVEVARALCRLAPGCDDDERPRSLEFLSAMLRAHPRNAGIAAGACEALDALLGSAAPACVRRCSGSAAGVAAVPLLVAALRAHARAGPDVLSHACGALTRLVAAAPSTAAHAAVRCCAADAVAALPPGSAEPQMHAALDMLLRAAADAHDAAPRCEPAAGEEADAGCERCAAQRAAGALCGAPGCGARRREGGAKLKRCGACRVAAYCGAEHQLLAWGSGHKRECRALAAQRESGDAA